MKKYIDIETRGKIQILHFKNNENLNALSTQMLAQISSALLNAEEDKKVDAVILYGGMKCFSSGSDIEEMKNKTPIEFFYDARTKLWDQIIDFKKPLLAATNRYVLGSGFELALMCDIIIAGEDAIFGNPEIGLGIMPGAAATIFLPQIIGKARAFEMMATGEQISAEEAYKLGIVSHLVAPEKTLQTALDIGNKISANPRNSVMFIKESLKNSMGPIQDARRMERMLFSLLFSSNDSKEGVSAYIERRPPKFNNN